MEDDRVSAPRRISEHGRWGSIIIGLVLYRVLLLQLASRRLAGGWLLLCCGCHLCFFAEWTEARVVADGIGATNIARKSCATNQNGVTMVGTMSGDCK